MGHHHDLSKVLGEEKSMTEFDRQYELMRITKTGSESLKQAFRDTRNILVHEGVEGHQVVLWIAPLSCHSVTPLSDFAPVMT